MTITGNKTSEIIAISTGKHCSRIMAELRLPGAIGFAEQETQDNATKDCGRHRRASKQASPAAHDKISVRALSGRHGVCETAGEGPSKDFLAQLLRQSMLVTRITAAAAYGTRLTFATRCLPLQLPAWSHRRRDSHSGLQSLASTSTRVSPRRHRRIRDSCPSRLKKTLVALAEKTPPRVSTSEAAKHAARSRGVVG